MAGGVLRGMFKLRFDWEHTWYTLRAAGTVPFSSSIFPGFIEAWRDQKNT